MAPDLPPDGSAIITPNMQYAELQELRKSVDKLVATVDPAFADVRKDVHDLGVEVREKADRAAVKALVERVDAQQAQIDTNTQWRNRLIGAIALLSALVAYGLLNLADLGIGGK